jgi:hypothetical protein
MDQRMRARIAFGLLALAIPAQFIVKAVAAEPYPGLFMPEFGNVPVHGTFTLTSLDVTVTFIDGQRAGIDVHQLLAFNDATPKTVVTAVFDRHLDPTDPRTVKWFRGRVAAIFPHRDAQIVVINVIRSTYAVADRSLISRHRLRSHRIEVG